MHKNVLHLYSDVISYNSNPETLKKVSKKNIYIYWMMIYAIPQSDKANAVKG